MKRTREPIGPQPERPRAPALVRAFKDGESSAGFWLTADRRFFIMRVSLTPSWQIYPGAIEPPEAQRGEAYWLWLEEHALSQRRFPSRRAALERLQDALQLDPFPLSPCREAD